MNIAIVTSIDAERGNEECWFLNHFQIAGAINGYPLLYNKRQNVLTLKVVQHSPDGLNWICGKFKVVERGSSLERWGVGAYPIGFAREGLGALE
ncbi:MAG: hypothetical protein ABFS56_34050, partial [Pseudomonadota bacterium]